MTGASKILTVSYGTFSCTLEGFDDPFNTMKAIAEYFRDLAADDRYFGAEPPTPDAAMLHRIAEREVHRRVEAKIDENGITLRTGDAVSRPTATEPAYVPEPLQSSPVVAKAPLPSTADSNIGRSAPVAAPVQTTSLPSVDDRADEGVAARLQRLRRAAALDAAAPAVPVVVAWATDEADDLYEDEHFEAVDEVSSFAGFDADADVGPEAALHDDTVQIVTLDLTPDLATEDDFAEPEQTAAEAITAAAEATFLADPVETEPEAFEPEAVETVAVADDLTLDDIEEHADITPDVTPVAETEIDLGFDAYEIIPAETAAEEVTAGLSDAMDGEVPSADAQDIEADEQSQMLDRLILGREDSPRVDPEPVSDDISADASILSDMISTMSQDSVPALSGSDASVDTASIAEIDADAEVASSMIPDDALLYDHMDLDTIDAADLGLVSADAPVPVEIQPEEIGQDLYEETTADLSDLAAMDGVSDDAPSSNMSEASVSEDDFDLADAPAAYAAPDDFNDADADTAFEDDRSTQGLLTKAQMARARVIKIRRTSSTERPTMLDATRPSVVDAAPVDAVAAPDSLSAHDEADLLAELAAAEAANAEAANAEAADVQPDDADKDKDADVARLLRQAETEMAEPESRRRLSAIAHLKAAVAATIAERRIGRGKAPAEEARLDPYRDDLARAVRPPRGDEPDASHPATDRPAPLVLVSEQRIDRPKVASTAAISAVAAAPAAPIVPVRPRRIVAGATSAAIAEPLVDAIAEMDDFDSDEDDNYEDAAIFADPRSFSEFAERLGAEDLSSLLQAAAAYAMEVEDMPSFTRPQLMRQIEAHGDTGSFQREDVLRSFGQLLRTGDFIKKRRGQYALQEGASILAEARKLGGDL
jgi:hypothetical protein